MVFEGSQFRRRHVFAVSGRAYVFWLFDAGANFMHTFLKRQLLLLNNLRRRLRKARILIHLSVDAGGVPLLRLLELQVAQHLLLVFGGGVATDVGFFVVLHLGFVGAIGDLWGGGSLVLIILLDANRLYKVPF